MSARIVLQGDWDKAVSEKYSKLWIHYKKPGTPPVCSFLHITNTSPPRVTDSEDGFHVVKQIGRFIDVSYQDGESNELVAASFQAPNSQFVEIHSNKTSILDISVTDGGLGVSCNMSDELIVWQSSDGAIRRRFSGGHVGTVSRCRFFPSGVVVLSAGADTRLMIWSAESGQLAATLAGHKAGVRAIEIIDRGRNVLSGAADGETLLWDIGQQTVLTSLKSTTSVVNHCAVVTNHNVRICDEQRSEREIGTEGKLLICAHEDGSVIGWNVHCRKQLFKLSNTEMSSANCCLVLNENLFLVGYENSVLKLYDLRTLNSPVEVCAIHLDRGPVLRMCSGISSAQIEFVVASCADGTCLLLDKLKLCEGNTAILRELTGPDCDAVHSITTAGNQVFTACRDGVIRKYHV